MPTPATWVTLLSSVGAAALGWWVKTSPPVELLSLRNGGFVVYGVCSLYLIRYFRRYAEDPKLATPDMFPQVPHSDAAKLAKANAAPPFEETQDKYLVIGAGFVGLGMSGGLTRHGIPFDIVEKEDNIAGNWRYGVYDTVHIISSRRTTEFKDFPMPSHYPDFPSALQMRDYLDSYAEHYNLRRRLTCNTSVNSVVPIDGGRKGWEVTLETTNGKKTTTKTIVYKGVLCALGHHWSMRMPDIEGKEKYTGRFCHSKQVRHPEEELKGKRVLVIGGGNSACDLAVEAGRYGAQNSAGLSVRHGVWFIPRTMFGKPMVDSLPSFTPLWLQRLILKILCRIVWGKYANYGFPEPTTRPFDTHPTINSDLLHSVKLGRVSVNPGIKRFAGGTKVEFTDGTVKDFDIVIAATGYNYSVPMLPEGMLEYKDGIPQLYSAFIPGYYNLGVLVGAQVRYGAGPIITSSAQAFGFL